MTLIYNNQHPVFVYGTLKRNFGNHHLLLRDLEQPSKFIGFGEISARMFSTGAFPICVASSDYRYVVKGEIYAVSAKTLTLLDALEGHPSFYQREEVEVYTLCDINKVYCYLQDRVPTRLKEVPEGVWI